MPRISFISTGLHIHFVLYMSLFSKNVSTYTHMLYVQQCSKGSKYKLKTESTANHMAMEDCNHYGFSSRKAI